MRNHNTVFAIFMFSLMAMLFFLTKSNAPQTRVRAFFWNIPESKGCIWPVKQIKYTKTEIKHIVPVAQVYKCTYDQEHRLVKVSTYNFERGYQMEIPTEEVLYKWNGIRLYQYSIRRATHGNGEIDIEVYTYHR